MDPVSIRSPRLDRISDLPRNVIDIILAFLPLKVAVRMSTLSKKWREKWHTLPSIIIDEEISKSTYGWWKRIEGMINYILTRHQGRIEKFSVIGEVTSSYNVKSWIRRLQKKGIEELFLHYRRSSWMEVPSNLFSCQQLRKLSLCGCVLNPARSSPRGFQSLITLELNNVGIETAAFEKLISSCPLLENLTVRNLRCVDHFQINVPKLKYCWFGGEFVSLRFNTPFLEDLSIISFSRSGYVQFDLRFKITGLPSTIKELYLQCEFRRYLAARETLPEEILYSRLRTLSLNKFCFEKAEQVQCLLSLITRSVNLTILDITACRCKFGGAVSEPFTKFWEKQNNGPSISNRLKKVRVRSFHGYDPEMKLIQYVMTNSPALEEMTVECVKYPEYDEYDNVKNSEFDEDKVKGVLQLLCKSSTQLNFTAATDDSYYNYRDDYGYDSHDSYVPDSD